MKSGPQFAARALSPARILASVLLQSVPACETSEQTFASSAKVETKSRTGFRAHHEPAVGLSAQPERARSGGRENHLIAGSRRTVHPERRTNPQGPRVFWRVRGPRRRLLRAR